MTNTPSEHLSFRELMAVFLRLLKPYWINRHNYAGWLLLSVIGIITAAGVWILTRLNSWYNDFYNSMVNLDKVEFQKQLIAFMIILVALVLINSCNAFFKSCLIIHWRRFMTGDFIRQWMKNDSFYKTRFTPHPSDNPDQRIAEDLREFVSLTQSLVIGTITSGATFFTFLVVLWNLSSACDFSIGSYTLHLPDGYLVYLAFIYAIFGTLIAFWIGHPLVKLNFAQQRCEADYRFALIRVRNNSESIAMYDGQKQEEEVLENFFLILVSNFKRLITKELWLRIYTLSYNQTAVIFPFLIASPLYFSGAINIGTLMQISTAFDHVKESLSTIIDNFNQWVRWKSVVDRLGSFQKNLREASEINCLTPQHNTEYLVLSSLEVASPEERILMLNGNLDLKKHVHLLIKGPSGCGKSTLLRAVSGLWPYARGIVSYPAKDGVLFMTQKPYLPIGTLRQAIAYPLQSAPNLDRILERVGLSHLSSKLDDTENWEQILSLGEQQRIAFARAFIVQPKMLFLDEATSALDEDIEKHLYEQLTTALKEATIISIGHRSTLDQFHDYIFECGGDNNWVLKFIKRIPVSL